MRFRIRPNDPTSPCEGAVRAKAIYVEIKYVKRPQDLPYLQRRGWYAVGSNHRMINGWIARDMREVDVWEVDLNSVEDVVRLIPKGREINMAATNPNYSPPMPEITIED